MGRNECGRQLVTRLMRPGVAAGAVLAMIVDTMIPEAFPTTHNLAGLITSAAIGWGRLRETQIVQNLQPVRADICDGRCDFQFRIWTFGGSHRVIENDPVTLDLLASDSVTLDAGYRYLAIDYKNGGFLFDVALSGPIIGASIRF